MQPPKVLEKNYPLVSDLKDIVSAATLHEKGNERAIDVLTGPIESFTNLPARMLRFIHKQRHRPVTYRELYQKAVNQQYDIKHVTYVLKTWLPENLMVAVWHDGQMFYQWLEQTEEEYNKRKEDHQWFEAIPT